ncbi:transposase [Kocuria sp. CNJ-770]|uniref:transposase n=1 Tax=Kocuria sp. CNJ-770 TaxID=1904964 RepID=UPI0035182E50
MNYTNLRLEPPDHATGRSWDGLSTKIHQVVDGNGLPRVTLVTAGQAGDSPMFLTLIGQLRVDREGGRPRTRPEAVGGDKAYSSRAIHNHLRSRGIKAVIRRARRSEGPPQTSRLTRGQTRQARHR